MRARGGDICLLYSPTDAVHIAAQNPGKQVVFFAVGFETTAPANAMSVFQATQMWLKNYSVLVSHILVPPAMEVILGSVDNRVQGFLGAGHVCTVMGYKECEPIAEKYKVPIVVTGFEPLDLLQGIYMCVSQLEKGRYEVENQYARSVRREGNVPALRAKTLVLPGRRYRDTSGQWYGRRSRNVRRASALSQLGLHPGRRVRHEVAEARGRIYAGLRSRSRRAAGDRRYQGS